MPAAVQRLVLRGFRGIVEGELELKPLTVLVGPNNSGKTSILEALLLLNVVDNEIPGLGLTVAEALSLIHVTLDSGVSSTSYTGTR